MKNMRIFLKRTKMDNLKLEDFYIGSTVNILSRQLNFVDYGDDFTRKKISNKKERYYCNLLIMCVYCIKLVSLFPH